MANASEVKVKVTADTAEMEAALQKLRDRAEGIAGGLVSVRTLTRVCVGLALLLVIVGTTLGVLHVRQAKALAKAEAYSTAQAEVVEAAEQRMEQREAAWQREREGWERERAAIKTAPQAVRIIEKYIPQTAGQSVAEVKPAQIAPEVREKLPDAASYVVKTEQAEVDTAKAVQAGEQCKANLLKCRADGVDLRGQVQAVTKDRDNWRNTAQGGSTARRAARGGFIGGCGAAGAAAGAGKGSKGAAIGALVGFVGCAILSK